MSAPGAAFSGAPLGFRNLLRRRVVGRLRERHVLLAAAVDQQAALYAEVLAVNAVRLADGGNAFFQLVHVDVDAAALKARS